MMRAMDSTDLILSSRAGMELAQERTPGSPNRALAICMAACTGLLCIGYESVLASHIASYDSFQSDFCPGDDCTDDSAPESWYGFTNWFSRMATIGYILGALLAGLLGDLTGRKWTIMGGSLVFAFGTLWVMLSPGRDVMIAGRVFQGVGGGMYTFVLPIYCVEVAAKEVRGFLAGFAQLMLGIGYIAGHHVTSEYAGVTWKLVYFASMVPAIMLALGSFFLPESPRWMHLQKGKELAEISLKRIRNTWLVEHELDAIASQASTFADMRGWKTLASASIVKRIVVATALQLFQLLFMSTYSVSYSSLMHTKAPELFISSSLGKGKYFFFSIEAICAIPAMYLVDVAGRRKLLLIGTFGMVIGLITTSISIVSGCDAELFGRECTQGSGVGLFIGTVVLMMSNMVCWMPVVWLYPAEMFPTNVRAKATAIAAMVSGASPFWVRELFPQFYELTLLPVVVCLLALALVFFLCLETKGMVLEATEELFKRGFHVKKPGDEMLSDVTDVAAGLGPVQAA